MLVKSKLKLKLHCGNGIVVSSGCVN